MKNAARKGNSKAVEFDKKVQAVGWELLAKEHRFSWGGMCNVAGFDRLYATRAGPTLVEVTTADRRADHRRAILERLEDRPLLRDNFRVLLVVYHPGYQRLMRGRKERVWAMAGTWSWEWLELRPGVCRICGCTEEAICIPGRHLFDNTEVRKWADEDRTLCTRCVGVEV